MNKALTNKYKEEVIEVKEPKIKIGDFVTFLDISNPNPKKVIDIKNDIVYTENNKCLISQCKLWKPTERELCWFRNSKWSKPEESIVIKYTKDLEKNYDLIEPYIDGKLPSWIKL